MADSAVVHLGENSPEYVAYRLLHEIMRTENKVGYAPTDRSYQQADRKYILDTYAECLYAVKGHR